MELFYQKLDTDENKDFKMKSFIPLPEELTNTTSPNIFRALEDEKKPVFRNGRIEMVQLDANGMTEDEFIANKAMLKETYGFDNWYDWQCANWGTKWDVAEPSEQHREEDSYSVSYETAWSPNLDFFRHISSEFPELTFTVKYYEGGVGFAGEFTILNGDEIDEEKEIGYIKLKIVANEEDDDDAPTVYHFITTDEEDEEEYEDYDEYLSMLDNNYEEVLTDYGIDTDQIENYNELVAQFS